MPSPLRKTALAALMLFLLPATLVARDDRELPGLRGQYFRDTRFRELAFERLDPQVDYEEKFHLPDGMDEQKFSARWTGLLRVPRDGEYIFSADADDEIRLWVGGALLLDTTDDAEVQLLEAKVRLSDGELPLRIDYRNTGGGGRARVFWSGPKFDRRPLDADRLRTPAWADMPAYAMEALQRDDRGKRLDRKPGWRGRYYQGRRFEKLVADQRDRNILRMGRFPLPDGRTEDLSVRWTGLLDVPRDGEYTFHYGADDGIRIWIDYRLVTEQWEDSGKEDRELKLRLRRGKHPILVEYYQGRGRSGVSLAWSGPKLDRRLLDKRYVSTIDWPTMSEPRPMVILLAMGHSNMEGRAKSARSRPCPHGYMYDEEGYWRQADNDDKGPTWPLLHELTAAYPHVDFGVVKVAKSAATLRKDFLPGKRSYRELIDQAKAARRFGPIAAAVIMQGWVECERSDSVDEARRIGEDYPKLIRKLRDDLDLDKLPVVASQIELGTGRKGREDRWAAIHQEIAALPEKFDHLRVIDANGLDMVDDHHFSRKGNEQWAKLAMEAFADLKAFDDLPEPKDSHDDGPIALPRRNVEPDKVIAEVDAVVRRHTPGRSLKQLGTYRNLLVVTEYEIRKVRKGKLPGKRVLCVEFAIRDGKRCEAKSLRKGSRRRLKLGSWRAQKKLRALPMDDDINDFDATLYYVLDGD